MGLILIFFVSHLEERKLYFYFYILSTRAHSKCKYKNPASRAQQRESQALPEMKYPDTQQFTM